MSKPQIFARCNAGCKWEVPHIDDVVTYDTLVEETNKCVKTADVIVNVPSSSLTDNNLLWNRTTGEEVDLTGILSKTNKRSIGISGSLKVTHYYAPTYSNDYNAIYKVPFSCLWDDFSEQHNRYAHISYVGYDNNDEYDEVGDNTNIQLTITLELLFYDYGLTVTDVKTTSVSITAGESPTFYEPEVKVEIESLNVFYI